MSEPLNVLLIEDSEDDALLVLRELRRGGFTVVWERVETAEALQTALTSRSWHVLISDYRLPGFDAPAALTIAKQSQLDLPFIVVSGTIGEASAVALMKAGAHDYLMKDNLTRLPEAVRRELREAQIRQERHQSAIELNLTQERLKLAIEGSGIGLWDWSVQTGDLTINDRWAAILGYTLAELEPISVETWRDHTHPDDLCKADEALERHFRQETQVYECEVRMRYQSRAWVWVLTRGKVVEWSADGKPLRMTGTHLDITSRKRSEATLQQVNQVLETRVQRRTAALKESEARLLEAQQIARLGSWEMDVQTYEITWSAELFTIFGLDPEQTAPSYNQLLLNYFPPDERDRLRHLIDRVIQFGEPYASDFQISRADGTTGYIFAKAELSHDESGEVTRVFGIAMDISDRKAMQEALQRSEERARATLLALPDLVFRVDRNGFYMDFLASPHGANLFNPEVVVGQSIYDAWFLDKTINMPIDHVNRKYDVIQQVLASKTVQTYEQQIWRGGTLRYEEVRVAPCGNDEVVFFIRDISDRKQAEHQLQESKDKFQRLVDDIGHKFVVFSHTGFTGVLTYVSGGMESVFGLPKEDVLDKPWAEAINWLPESIELAQSKVLHILDTEKDAQQFEMHYYHVDGTQHVIQVSQHPVVDHDGNLVAVDGIVEDITDRKHAEEQLRRTNEELARATRLKDEFLANMSHELRTPLNSILGMTEGLQDAVFGDINERQLTSLKTIERSSNHLLDLINDILDIAKIESGQVELDCTPTAISTLCQASLTFVKQQALKKNIQLDTNLPPNLPDLFVDERRIRQVLINLLSNAVKFTPDSGCVTLEASYIPLPEGSSVPLLSRGAREDQGETQPDPPQSPLERGTSSQNGSVPPLSSGAREDQRDLDVQSSDVQSSDVQSSDVQSSNVQSSDVQSSDVQSSDVQSSPEEEVPMATGFLRIAVIDTGIGISSENITKLFKPFVQIDSALNRQYAGTGLGLALVKRIVELHGGQVGVTSKVNIGSCFTLYLPHVPAIHGCPVPVSPVKPSNLPSQPVQTISPLILLAEDNEANISTMSSYLTAKGYRLLIAKNGQEAIELAQTKRPDVILMDIQMPGMDGLEATRQIRCDPTLVNVPIIALTALAMDSDRDRCLAAGATNYLSKPVKLKQLVTIIHQVLAVAMQETDQP